MAIRIFLLEDDRAVAKSVVFALQLEKWIVDHVSTLAEARAYVENQRPDLLLLDVSLPDGTSYEFAREAIDSLPGTPILMLTARTDEDSAVKGFSSGAMDYIRKPVGARELVARIKKALGDTESLNYGPIQLRPHERSTLIHGKNISLAPREFDILSRLIRKPDAVIAREEFLNRNNSSEDTSDRVIDSHLSKLRRKLRKAGATEVEIQSIYGSGYKITRKAG